MGDNIKRHGYCIIAHADPYCLQTLLSLIDDKRNDIFILYDKKTDRTQFSGIQVKQANLEVLDPTVDIRWGDISLVEAELKLLEAAHNSNQNYEFIHLISGCDLPLMSQDQIYEFCESLPGNMNIIDVKPLTQMSQSFQDRALYSHILTKYYRSRNFIIRQISKILRNGWILLQKGLGLKKGWKEYTLGVGSNWASLRSTFVEFLIENKSNILTQFKDVMIPDEMYKQTLLLSSEYKGTNYSWEDGKYDCLRNMRKIDWTRGNPYTWTNKEFDELMNSGGLFARKFSSSVDRDVIDRIRDRIIGKENEKQ